MNWEDRFKPGSFRNVPFNIDASDSEFGRRTAEHEFPGRDVPFVEDLGRKARRFTIDAFLIGQEYLDARDALLDACEQEGSGELIHPYFGSLTVICTGFRTRDSRTDRRMVTVQMSFVEVGEFEFQTVLPATIPKTQESAAELVEQNKTTFEKLYDRASLPYAKAQAVNATVTAGVNKVQEVNTLMKRIAEFPQEVQNILGSVDSLVLSGASVADSISGLVGMGFFDDLLESAEGAAFPEEVSDRFKIAAKDIKELFNFSPSVDASSASTDATIKLIQVAALGSYVQAMTRMDFESADEVFLFRDEVIAKIDSLLEETLDDDLFVRLEDLRADIIEDTDARAVNLARLTEIILPQTTPSLVLMNRLYGSIGQEQDFLERNQIPHPGFIVGAVPWKVLLNA